MSDPDAPPKFYKYRSMGGDAIKFVERTVLHNEIYFAPAASFNDPFELRPPFSLVATPEQQRADFVRMSRKFEPNLSETARAAEADRVMADALRPENLGRAAAQMQASHADWVTRNVGIYCVSSKCDDILMWSHYADSHAGICLEFDQADGAMARAQKVSYAAVRLPINPYADDQLAMVDKALLTKSDHWSYEGEWRSIRYQSGPGVVRFRPEHLTGIIIGARATEETVAVVHEWVRSRPTPCRIARASVSNEGFELLISTN